MPIGVSDGHLTFVPTPCLTMQWRVLSMELKNSGSSEKDVPNASVYFADVLIGSRGNTVEELILAHFQDVCVCVCVVLTAFEAEQLVSSPKKSDLFPMEVQFGGHILREGTR